jgi:hypothetical protein
MLGYVEGYLVFGVCLGALRGTRPKNDMQDSVSAEIYADEMKVDDSMHPNFNVRILDVLDGT